MNSDKKENVAKSTTPQPSTYQQKYVVAFSLNEKELTTPNETKLSNNLHTDILLSDDITNDITSGIRFILTEVIENIDEYKDKIKHESELIYGTELSGYNFICNSDFKDGNFSSSNASTDTITNMSSSNNSVICSKDELSNTTLKVNYDDTEFSNKHSIDSFKRPMGDDELPVVKKNLNSALIMDKISIKNLFKENIISEDAISNESPIAVDNIVSPFKTDCLNVNFLETLKNSTISLNEDKIAIHLDKNNIEENKGSVNVINNISNASTDEDKCNSISKIFNENKNSISTLVGSAFSGVCSNNEDYLENKNDNSTFSLTSCSQYYSSTDENMDSTNENCNTAYNVLPTTSYIKDPIKTNVIISDGMLYKLKSKGDCQYMDDLNHMILKKSFDVEVSDNYQTRVNSTLPNEATIQKIITERDNLQKITCSEESQNIQPFCDMWEKISITLDFALKKIEESLSDKILSEFKTTLNKIESYVNQIAVRKANESHDVNAVEKAESVHEEGLQCSIIQSYTIDNLMFKLSGDGESERSAKTKILKIRNPKVLADTFEVLKAYSQPAASPTDEDSLKISSGETETSTEPRRRMLFHAPMRFLKENTIVLGSVPAFFFYVFLIFGLIMLVVKV